MADLFSPFALRDVTLPNRIAVSPMCQYSCDQGLATDWHLVHLGARAVGGAGLVMTEAAAVAPEGRISPEDLGIWNDAQAEALARVTRFVARQGSVPGIQLAHAGRKASTLRPWSGTGTVTLEHGGWTPVGPGAEPFSANYPVPDALDIDGIDRIVRAFAAAAERALRAGFLVVELHAAHGYLIHEFLSPLSNRRIDLYGGSFDGRTRFLHEAVAAIRSVWPERLPLLIRISATDWTEGGWEIEQSVELARSLKALGADLIDCSSGGNVERAEIPVGPGYQTGFAARIRHEAGIATGAVGMITGAAQADHILRTGQADLVFLAREMLRDPYWPLHAAAELGHAMAWPAQYLRAAPRGTPARG